MSADNNALRIAFIGFGEAGRCSEEMREAGEMLSEFGFDAELALAVANAQARGAKPRG